MEATTEQSSPRNAYLHVHGRSPHHPGRLPGRYFVRYKAAEAFGRVPSPARIQAIKPALDRNPDVVHALGAEMIFRTNNDSQARRGR